MKFIIYCLLSVLCACHSSEEKILQPLNVSTHFEVSNGTETGTYYDVIKFYSNLAATYPSIAMDSIGNTDAGKPLHFITYNPDAEFNFEQLAKHKAIVLINNGIHPGESDGIDATMLLFRDLAQGKLETLKNTVLVTIPIYNVGGSLNRNTATRTNQNGPKEYGFRGNARNYDLNRDFIKSDTKNARVFAALFHKIQPDIFVDNHVSNGADYQYTLTHLFTQHNKLGGELGAYLHEKMMPDLELNLANKNWDITPYVNVFNTVPDNGFSQFLDAPRYSTGYTTLFNTLGIMVETHMLKPYKQRVEGTYELMKTLIGITETDYALIKEVRNNNIKQFKRDTTYKFNWVVDTTKHSVLNFKGYEGEIITSEVTNLKRLKYNRDRPFTKAIIYNNYFKATQKVTIPVYYVIPQGWHNVLSLLQLNNIKTEPLAKDSIIEVERYKIEDFKTRRQPYEGHYSHYDTTVVTDTLEIAFRAGDILVNTNQDGLRYVLETLEPSAIDSFFNWNFFDTILQQKEGFSPYVWEDKALALLETNPELKTAFEKRKTENKAFRENWYSQLDWLHKRSVNYEKAHLHYPIYRITE
ncbi:hypothetical protein ES677_03320 [Bizionia gelidisalsuginis]|uniref:Peptidase M14 carboxypeptidase A domain-containing protein n=1 Tax=Bizionia gelidisalsuginis TaxID=291188 RepID=A0ABY3MCV5_9FLAO|nr:M14 family metallopeptidase [Bizionia gelidisalsuginis]TYC16215.1 hypothetical protein ES677_03320 [Bizionia gelidisalsuginis]